MSFFPGYVKISELMDLSHSIVYLGVRESDGLPVIIKLLKEEFPEELLAKAKKEFHLSKHIKLTGVSWPLDLITTSRQLALVLENKNKLFLSVTLAQGAFSIPFFLKVALNLTKVFCEIHGKNIIHKDVRSNNILVNQETGEVDITGLFIHEFITQKGLILSKNLEEDSFVYTSPEQTGRISWQVDHRSDLYSLGVVFYEMLTGRVPFASHNPIVRIHGHIAKKPKDLQVYNPEIPEILNNIIQKLLSKSAEDRYQSAKGLQEDLQRCWLDSQNKQQLQSFKLAQQDTLDQFHMPTRLYGAQSNLLTLIDAFNRVCTGSVELMMVRGKAGMGKTSIIQELQKLVHKKGGFFTRGKFEKENKDTPYSSLIKAVQALVHQILTESEVEIEKWKNRFLESLGRNGQVVIDFIPEMEIVIGEQPKVPQLDAGEAQNRFNHIFQRLIHTFTLEGKPLVLFLDSFHWADSASIRLIQSFLSDLNSRYVFVIIAFRKSLVLQQHTLAMAVEEIEKSGTLVQDLEIKPLTSKDIELLVEEALGIQQDFHSLASLLYEKTDGNPFFVKQLLQTFHEKKLIYFDADKRLWSWDVYKIHLAGISDDVVELMADKILNLPPETVSMMQLASCMGSRFDMELLSLATEKSEGEILQILDQPISTGLIVSEQRLGNKEQEAQFEAVDGENEGGFRFLHSRVYHATYSMLSTEDKKSIHLRLGRLLLKTLPESELSKNAYKIVNHLNKGIRLITEANERQQLAGLNLLAGKKARASAAYDTAWKYFAFGTDLLTVDSWERDYELTKELYLRRSESEYFSGNTEAAEPIFSLLLKHVKTKSEKVEVINIKLNLYIKNGQLKQAVAIGIDALYSLFREKVPPNDAEVTIISQVMMQEMQATLDQTVIENLIFMMKMKKENQISIMEIMTNIIPAAYLIRRNLWILLTLKMVETSISHGNTKTSAYGYMNYAVILCSGLEDYNAGYSMGRLALNLNEKFNHVELSAKLNFLFGSYICHWKNDARECIKYLNRAYASGVEFGDFFNAANSVNFLLKTHIIVGSPLEEIQKEIQKHQDFIDQFNSKDLKNVIRVSSLILTLQEEGEEGVFKVNTQETAAILQELKQSRNSMPMQWYFLINAILSFHFYDYEEALAHIQESDKLIAGYSQLSVPEHYFYYSLIITVNYQNFSRDEKKRYWDLLKNNHQKLKKLASSCPSNFDDKYLLISAQMAAISGNFIDAIDLFDRAIQAAAKNGFLQNEAIANELAAKYFLSRNKKTIAQAYLKETCHAYMKWGASAKLRHLETTYPSLFIQTPLLRRASEPPLQGETYQEQAADFFDFADTIKSFQLISKEMSIKKLIEKILHVFLENAGAQKGVFLLDQDGQMIVKAEAAVDGVQVHSRCNHPLDTYPDIASNIIYYVIRTRKHVVLEDAGKQGMFIFDSYVIEQKPKSILCMPISTRGRVVGVIYLENNLTAHAFSQERVDLLLLLANQAAISLKNSLQYEHMAGMIETMKQNKVELEEKIIQLEHELEEKS
ncbi:MAG: hypothetical protein COB67_10855 [SAR324 cluster bacterium]|uniref:Protein kinase domain-containing protein n=1 Tax=SAR324 cluster bacterium TaxID=2024889 RepID=A0A2A4SWH7_9DELT|nr:MAG: hypothetical protein COB67_10855 [SAR324 cluster bacterium]